MAALDDDGRRRLETAFQRFEVRGKGTVVFNQGAPAHYYFLCHGSVKLTHASAAGEEVILDVLSAPAVLSIQSHLGSGVQRFSAVSIAPLVRVAHIKIQTLLDVTKDYSKAMEQLVLHLKQQTEKAYQTIACMTLPVRERLLAMLGLNFLLQGTPWITVPLSSLELAQWVQTAPETMSRTLQQLRAEGIVAADSREGLNFKTSAIQQSLEAL